MSVLAASWSRQRNLNGAAHNRSPRWSVAPRHMFSITVIRDSALVSWNVRTIPSFEILCADDSDDRLSVECRDAAIRLVEPRQQVEEGRLACAIRPDQRRDLRCVVPRGGRRRPHEPAETPADPVRDQDRDRTSLPRVRSSRRTRVAGCPSDMAKPPRSRLSPNGHGRCGRKTSLAGIDRDLLDAEDSLGLNDHQQHERETTNEPKLLESTSHSPVGMMSFRDSLLQHVVDELGSRRRR